MLSERENMILWIHLVSTYIQVLTVKEYSCFGIPNLLIMNCDPLTYKVAGFTDVFIPTASAFHDINNIFHFTGHGFVNKKSFTTVKFERVVF